MPKLALATATGAPITVAIDALKMMPIVADKTIKDLQESQKKQYIY